MKKGTGPTSTAGKRISSRNSTKHGCRSRERILPGESAEEYDALWREWLSEYTPESDFDLSLIDAVVNCAWRLRRADKALQDVERAMLSNHAQGPTKVLKQTNSASHGGTCDEASDGSKWSDEHAKRLQLMQRYRTTAENSFNKAWRAVRVQCELKKAARREFQRKVEETLESFAEPERAKAKALVADVLAAKHQNAPMRSNDSGECPCPRCQVKQAILDEETRMAKEEERSLLENELSNQGVDKTEG